MFAKRNESEWTEINIDVNIDSVAEELKKDFTEKEIRSFCAMACQDAPTIPEKDKIRYQFFQGLTNTFSKENYEMLSQKLLPVSTFSTPLLHSYSAQSKHQLETSETPKKRSRCCGLF